MKYETYIIADIHGCANTLERLLNKIIQQAENTPKFVFTGDYVDRGLHSKRTIDILIDLQSKYDCVFLRGNHDDVICDLIGEKSYLNRSLFTNSPVHMWFAQHGLIATLESYGITKPEMDSVWFTSESSVREVFLRDNVAVENIGELLRSRMPESHIKFLQNMQLMYIGDNFFCTHAWYPNEEVPRDPRFIRNSHIHDILWGRVSPQAIDLPETGSKWNSVGIFGHTPTSHYTGKFEPVVRDHFILLDTGSCFKRPEGASITAYCLENRLFISEQTVKEDQP